MHIFSRPILKALLGVIIFLTCPFQALAQETAEEINTPTQHVTGRTFTAGENTFNGRLVLGPGGGVKFSSRNETPLKYQALVLADPKTEISFEALAFHKVELGLLEAKHTGTFIFKVDYTKGLADHLTILDAIDLDPEQFVVILPQAASVEQADEIALILDKSKKLVFHLKNSETIKLGDNYYQLLPTITDDGVIWSLRRRS